jgi:hypothetical protein
MPFPQLPSSDLLVGLSEEQQELVAGGVSGEPQVFEYTYTNRSEKSKEDARSNTYHLQKSIEAPSAVSGMFLTPLLIQLSQLIEQE